MSDKPLFVATHPRACSTAFERVFMTRRDLLKCVHEPFGDAYYFGPERLAERYADDEKTREASGFSKSTYQIIMERINQDNTEGKRLFIKDMAQYFFPPSKKAVSIAPSLVEYKRGVGTNDVINGDAPLPNGDAATGALTNGHATNGITTNGEHKPLANGHVESETAHNAGSHFATRVGYSHVRSRSNPPDVAAPYQTFTEIENPTVIPTSLLEQFHFAFLIRHPRYSIPSYYRCCIPPLEDLTGFHKFRPDEAGYCELRRFFDYLRTSGQIGPKLAGQYDAKNATNGDSKSKIEICMIDADDLLDDPEGIMSVFCNSVGVPWTTDMLNWNSDEEREYACEAFEKWKGFHEDAIHSNDLKARKNKRVKTDEELYREWVTKYGKEGADTIRKTVEENLADYEYLKQYCIKKSSDRN